MLQVISFLSIQGDNSPATNRTITARPQAGQFIDRSLIDRQVLNASTDENGVATITLIAGISYEIKITGWGSTVITVSDAPGTAEDPYAFSNYLISNESLVDPATGTGVALSVAAQDGTIWQLTIFDNGDGTYTPQFSRIA